jgi:hypothetical protein
MTRFYVTMTWDDFPEGGSFGTVIDAADHAEAEALCRREMAETRADEDTSAEYYLEHYGPEWNVIDCFDLDDFIERHRRPRVVSRFCRRFLDLCTSHVQEATAERLNNGLALASNTPYGWLVPVPACAPALTLTPEEDTIPADLARVLTKARELKCDYVLFDRDAPKLDGLQTWEW